jgi:hypothetical protein
MPNGFAYLVLFAYLPFGIALFTALRPALAGTLVFLGSFMFLPERTELDLPGLPSIGKQEIAVIACLLGAFFRARKKLWAAKPLRGLDLLILLLFVGNFATALTNKDSYMQGRWELPGLTTYEAVSMCILDSLRMLFPFLLGRALITSAKDLKTLLVCMAVAGAAYTPLLAVELAMSPQMHNWFYGFAQHSFDQTVRGGGYRPMVFMTHGLAVGLFMCWAVLAAVTLHKARKKTVGVPPMFVGIYNFGWLVACKSLGAAIYAFTMAPLLAFLKPKTIARLCMLVGLLVLIYPVLRMTDVFPHRTLISTAESVAGAQRAQSLGFRFEMEELITNHTAKRPLFGWGRFKRASILDEWSGREVSVADGFWIITYSMRGAWGYACMFLALVIPVLVLGRRLKRVEATDERAMLAGLGMIVAVSLIDLLPNALWNVFSVFLIGALWGVGKELAKPRPPEQYPYPYPYPYPPGAYPPGSPPGPYPPYPPGAYPPGAPYPPQQQGSPYPYPPQSEPSAPTPVPRTSRDPSKEGPS